MRLGSLTTTLAGAGTLGTTTTKFVKAKPDERESMIRSTISAGITTTSTTIAQECFTQRNVDQIYEKYSSAYMESRTDDELTASLRKLDYLDSLSDEEFAALLQRKQLLPEESEQKETTKSL